MAPPRFFRFRRASRGRLLLYAAFALALGFTGYHVARAVTDAIYWRQHRDEPIRDWMTIGYVAHSYRVPPHVLQMALGLPPVPPDRRPLSLIARSLGRSDSQLAARLRDAIVHARPPFPPPGPPPRPDAR